MSGDAHGTSSVLHVTRSIVRAVRSRCSLCWATVRRWVRHLQAAAAVEMAAVVLAALEAVLAVVVLAVASAAAAAPPNSSRTK